MFSFIQEATLPKLSQTSLYSKFETTSSISAAIKAELSHAITNEVKADKMQEILSLIKLNGDAIAKKAAIAYEQGQIIIVFNKQTTKVPMSVPYIIINKGGVYKAYIFADRFMDNISSAKEYTKLMAILEAAYLALLLNKNQNVFIRNRQLMLTLCNIYTLMVVTPLELKLYMKGENLQKAMLYIMGYFYRMIDGPEMDIENIPYKRLMMTNIDNNVAKQIFTECKNMVEPNFMDLIKMITQINPVRYKDLETLYMSYFTTSCGVSLIFALENLQYLFILVGSAPYKTPITQFSLNKVVSMPVKKAITLLSAMSFE